MKDVDCIYYMPSQVDNTNLENNERCRLYILYAKSLIIQIIKKNNEVKES